MAIKDVTKKPYIEDREENIFIGIDYPFHRSDGVEGWFASTATTIEAVKVNIKSFLLTNPGERLMQPELGIGLKKYVFEQFTDETRIAIENEIADTLSYWMPFIEIKQ